MRIASILEKFKSAHGETVNYWLNMAHVASQECIDYQLYGKARDSKENYPLIDISKGLSAVIDPSAVIGELNYKSNFINKNARGDLVHLFACDSSYFIKYSRALIESSYKKSDIDVIIHAHIIDPTEDAISMADYFVDRFGIDYSTGFSSPYIEDKKSYYTTVRFLVADELLAVYMKPILITETDCKISWNWSHVQKWCSNIDYGLCLSGDWNLIPWAKIPAGAVWLSPSASGFGFAKEVRSYICKSLWDSIGFKVNIWGIDQLALWNAHLKHSQGAINKNIPMYSVLNLAIGDKSNILQN
jgi:hypothetical protein